MASAIDRITVVKGNITTESVDAIVNAANTELLLGGGVAGAIRTMGGPTIQQECDRHGPVSLGGAALTGAGELSARYVIHAAAMRLGGHPTPDSIRQAVANSLKTAEQSRFEVVSFPAIGTGIGGFSVDAAAEIIVCTVVEFLNKHEFPRKVRLILLDALTHATFTRVVNRFDR